MERDKKFEEKVNYHFTIDNNLLQAVPETYVVCLLKADSLSLLVLTCKAYFHSGPIIDEHMEAMGSTQFEEMKIAHKYRRYEKLTTILSKNRLIVQSSLFEYTHRGSLFLPQCR